MKYFCIMPKNNSEDFAVKVFDESELSYVPSLARYMSSIIVSEDGKVIKNRYGPINFPLPKEAVKAMPEPELIIKLSTKGKNEMNKAQREEIYATADRMFKDRDFIDQEEFRQTFWEFAKRFEQIDSKPDPEKYVIMFKDNYSFNEWTDNSRGKATFSKEEAEINLQNRISAYSSDLLEYRKGEYLKYKVRPGVIHEFKVVKV